METNITEVEGDHKKWILLGLSISIEIVFSSLNTKFEPFLYFEKVMASSLKFWLIGAGSLKWGRLAGFLCHNFFNI